MGRMRPIELMEAGSIRNDGARSERSTAGRPCRDRMDGQGPFDEFQDGSPRFRAGAARTFT
jgi:hypothetical protein